MNVFEYLELPKNHREAREIVQLVCPIGVAHKEAVKSIEFPQFIEENMHGVPCIVIFKGREVKIFAQTGEKLNNVQMLETDLTLRYVGSGHKDSAVMATLVCGDCSSEELLSSVGPRCLTPLPVTSEEIYHSFELYCTDRVSLDSFIFGREFEVIYAERRIDLHRFIASIHLDQFIETPMQLSRDMRDAMDFSANIIDSGGRGAVLKEPNAGWGAGIWSAPDWSLGPILPLG